LGPQNSQNGIKSSIPTETTRNKTLNGDRAAKKNVPMDFGNFLTKNGQKTSAQKSLNCFQLFYINVISNPHVLIFCDTSYFPKYCLENPKFL